MTASQITQSVCISEVWQWLGGEPPRRGRAKASWREGSNEQAVTLNDTKGCWYDFRDSRGGGVIDLIRVALGVDGADAIRWLSERSGLSLDESPGDSRRLHKARTDAERLVEWKAHLLDAMASERAQWQFKKAFCFACLTGNPVLYDPAHPCFGKIHPQPLSEAQKPAVSKLWRLAAKRDVELSRSIALLENAPYEDLLPIWGQAAR